jgi:hypothetical protein
MLKTDCAFDKRKNKQPHIHSLPPSAFWNFCQENVISNIMKGSTLLELSGMTDESVVNGVKIWRPLLHNSKDQIYAFSEKYAVPHFKDTTPKWR